jgi:hypothetical protein
VYGHFGATIKGKSRDIVAPTAAGTVTREAVIAGLTGKGDAA